MDEELKEILDQLKNAVNDLTDVMGGTVTTARKYNDAIKETTELQAEAGETLEEFQKRVKEAIEKQQKANEEKKKERELNQALNDVLRTSVSGLSSFKDALLDTKDGLAKYSKTLDSVGDAAIDLGKNFGLLGLAAGVAVKGLTTLAGASLKQSEASLKFRDDITKMGGVGAGTSSQLLDLAQAAGVSSKNLDILAKPMAGLQGGLRILGDTAGQGAKAFLDMTAVSAATRKEFRRLGLTQEELIQSQADYVKLQMLSGSNLRSEAKDRESLRKSSLEYTKNLVELAAISGTDLETAKKNQEFAAQQYAEVLRTRQENMKIDRLREQMSQARTAAEKKAIQEQIDGIKFQQESRKALGAQAKELLGEKDAAALMEAIATGITGPNAASLLTRGINPILIKRELESAKTEEERQKIISKNIQDIAKKTNQNIEQMGSTLPFMEREAQERLVGSQEGVVKAGNILNQDLVKGSKEARDAARAQAKEGKDANADLAASMKELEIGVQILLDNLVQQFNPKLLFATVVIGGLATAAAAATLALRQLSMSGALGSGKAAQTIGKGAAQVGKGVSVKGMAGGAVAGIGGMGLSMAGQAVGGKTGAAMDIAGQGLSMAGTGAMVGSMFGPLGTAVGAAVGGLAGLTMGYLQNKDALSSNTEEVDKSTEIANDFATYQKEREQKLKESNEKLNEILKDNSAALAKFKDKLGTISDEEFERLINSTQGLSETLSDAQKEALIAQRKEAQAPGAETVAADAAATEFKQISEELKFTSEDQKALDDKKRQIEMVQKDLFKAQNYEERKRLENIIKSLRDEKKVLDEKKKAEEEYNKLERERVAKEKEKQKERDATNKYLADLAERSKAAAPPTAAVAGSRGERGGTRGRGRPAGSSAPGAAPVTGGSSGGASGGGAAPTAGSVTRTGDPGADASPTGSGGTDIPRAKARGAGGTMSDQETKEMIKQHEGVRYEPYKDSLGLWTVGVGHLIGDGRSLPPQYNRRFSEEEVMSLFDKDYEKHKQQARQNVPGFEKYDSMGQAAFIDLTFNMGPGWPKKFVNTSKKIEAGDTEGAARGLEDSLWYRQVASRGPKIVSMVENATLKAKKGGIASGPDSGYPAELHGKEAIIPLGSNSLFEKMAKMPADNLEEAMSKLGMKENIAYSKFKKVSSEKLQEKIDELGNKQNLIISKVNNIPAIDRMQESILGFKDEKQNLTVPKMPDISEMLTTLSPKALVDKLYKNVSEDILAKTTTKSEEPVKTDNQSIDVMKELAAINLEMKDIIAKKLDDMIDKLGDSNSIQQKILKSSAA